MGRTARSLNVLPLTVALLGATTVARASPPVEVGASLASVTAGLGDNAGATFGVPSSGFGLFNPGVYVSILAGSHVAIEPQVGLILDLSAGESQHILNVTGQIDYFVRPASERSPYLFAAVGVIDTSGSRTTPTTTGAGVGYRIPLGDRLAVRMDGRMTHLTDGGGNSLTFTLSIGGLFGRE
jgi:hypothetical protein